MRIDFEGARLYVRPGPTDLRKGVAGLLAIIENEMLLAGIDFWCAHEEIKFNSVF